jgi:CheY-like chemotaxis protein
VAQTLLTVVAPKAAGRKLELVFDLDPSLPPRLVGDPLRIEQVLINYTNNAIKFSEQGRVEIRVRKVAGDANDCLVRFEVSDQGIGLSEAEMARLFVSFQQADTSTTREYGGTGLGLAICKELAQLMGGEVGVDSQLGVGSTFWFTARLGVSRREVPALINEISDAAAELLASAQTSAVMAALKRSRILLAEDNSFNQQIAREMLEDAGATVCLANNGVEALELLRRAEFDCVLMDLQMPQMDGLEATRRIRADPQLSHLRVLAMTATATTEARGRCIDAGMDDFISKPIQPALMYQTIAKWLPDSAGLAAPQRAPLQASAPEAVRSADPAVIDLSVLADLIGDDPDKLQKFALKFLQSAEEGVRDMAAALACGDVQAVRELGHRLKASARTVGAFGMADLCQALEQLAPTSSADEIALAQPMVEQLKGLLEQVRAHIQQK